MKDLLDKLLSYAKRNPYIVSGVGLGLILITGGTFVAISKLRGKRLTKSTLGQDDFIIEDPYILAQQAKLPIATYSLARVIASEAGGSDDINEKIALGWVVRNEAKHRGVSIVDLILRSNKGSGRYGKQRQGRFVGSSLDPYERDADVAQNVLTSSYDPTNGAVKFFNYSAQEKLSVSDPGRHRPAEEIIAKWEREGFVRSGSIGNNVFFRRA